jgi:predicted O-methyltransferase YrrM
MRHRLKEKLKAVRENLRQVVLRLMLRRIQRSPQTRMSDLLFELLAWGWGNRAYIVEVEYLRAIVDRAREATGSILECGSGLSTLVTGALIDGSKTTLYALEHDPDWYARISAMVEKFDLRNVRPVYAPLNDFGEFCWYGVTEDVLPRDISLVLCDGPPGQTKGGRYGFLPVMRAHLLPNALILIDDYKRVEEQAVVERWIREFGGSLTVMGTRFPYAILTDLAADPSHPFPTHL